MALNWDSVREADVRQACEMIADGQHRPRAGAKGIFVKWNGQLLPAKHILRLAYLLANRLSLDTPLKFSSDEGTILRLQKLGFEASRISANTNGE